MGNDHSSDNRGNIFVRTEKPYYFAGDTVNGIKIYFLYLRDCLFEYLEQWFSGHLN